MSVENAEKYSLYQFTLIPASGSISATQSSVHLGDFLDVEEVFKTASRKANTEMLNVKLSMKYEHGIDKMNKVRVVSTEFGYDVMCEHTIMVRFWIHIS